MKCWEALNLLYDVVERSASGEQVRAVREHVGGCRNCYETYRREGAVRELIARRLANDESGSPLDKRRADLMTEFDYAVEEDDTLF